MGIALCLLRGRGPQWNVIIDRPQEEPRITREYTDDDIRASIQRQCLPDYLRISTECIGPEASIEHYRRRCLRSIVTCCKQPSYYRTGARQRKDFARYHAGVGEHRLAASCKRQISSLKSAHALE